jgi:hypothetical protein
MNRFTRCYSVFCSDIDMFFNNAGGIRADWCYNSTAWMNTGSVGGTRLPALLN